ncbi:U6 snRNA-associated Sm-like protein LSm4 isoform X1 [Populus alba x Populus x berolinensis]|nr:U6 snRNA-associated Sm-like protein LSm4 isoform X1 [Populus alba x Populus x berolinensis]
MCRHIIDFIFKREPTIIVSIRGNNNNLSPFFRERRLEQRDIEGGRSLLDFILPLSLLKTAQGHPMLVELKNGETYNGHLVNCDTWMNIHLREVICTSKDGDRFWRMPECYIRGNTIKYLRVPDEVIDKVQEETKSRSDRKPPGVGRGRGRGREDGPGGRPAKGIGRGLADDGGPKGMGGGRGRGGPGGKTGGSRGAGRGRG